MPPTLRRQINDEEKKQIFQRHGRKCYATGHDIPENENVQFDHIHAFSTGGESEINNIAPMCERHNKEKGTLPLHDFRIKLRLDEFFHGGQELTLKDELEFFKKKKWISTFGERVYTTTQDDKIEIEVYNEKRVYTLHTCPITEWKYFYAILPIDILNSDDDTEGNIGLQPRYLIQTKVFELYRHLQKNTVLHPSIARLHDNKILVFDGQHKIAALLWGDRKIFELKIYIDPVPHHLNQTIIAAHDKFAQTKFYSSIMVSKLGGQFGSEFEEYKNREDSERKTETGFINFLKQSGRLTKADINKRFTSFLYDAVLDNEENKIARLVSKGNRSTKDYPLTMDMLTKSFFANFLCREPTDDDLVDTQRYLRDKECANTISLCNIIDEEILHLYDPTKTENDTTQNQLNRMFRSKSIMAWSELLRDAIAGKLDISDQDDRVRLFYRVLSEEQLGQIKLIVRRLVVWSLWKSPVGSEIDRVLSDNKSEVKAFFKNKGLTTGYLMGAKE